jgi:plasmid stability protein
MVAMTIRKLSETAVSNLKAAAKANGRSAEAEARLALEAKYQKFALPKSATHAIDAWKKNNGGGIDIPIAPRSLDTLEPPDFG